MLERKIYYNGFYNYYYVCDKCKCESISLKHLGGFQPADLVCDNCESRVMDNKHKITSDIRQWWVDLSKPKRDLFAIEYFNLEMVNDLSDNDLEYIWSRRNDNNQEDSVDFDILSNVILKLNNDMDLDSDDLDILKLFFGKFRISDEFVQLAHNELKK